MSTIDLSTEEEDKLRHINRHIEENMRADARSGMDYIDPARYEQRLASRQNHVVFGRRGSGKTSLLQQLEQDKELCRVYIDVEFYKEISFPNIVLHMLKEILNSVRVELKSRKPLHKGGVFPFWFRKWTLTSLIGEIDSAIMRQDRIPTSRSKETSSSNTLGLGGSYGPFSGSAKTKSKESVQKDETYNQNKVRNLYRRQPRYKRIIERSLSYIKGTDLFIMLDDLYFVSKTDQPRLIDFFHKITKNTNAYIKVATIKNRSVLYSKNTYTGAEIGHDIHSIDLDYTLDDFDNLKKFMEMLLNTANEQSDGYFGNLKRIFAGNGFNALCLASGGVPRDFLSLFRDCADSFVIGKGKKIGVKEVREKAIDKVNDKKNYLREDAGPESEVLDKYVTEMRDYVIRQRDTNAFLVAKQDLDDHPKSRQALMELVDLRLIHLLDKNTSKASSDGRRYEAYMMDVGLYKNTKPRDFDEVQPGAVDEESRKRQLRSSPVLNLSEIESTISEAVPFEDFQVTNSSAVEYSSTADMESTSAAPRPHGGQDPGGTGR